MKKFIVIIFVFLCLKGSSQFVDLGQDPASIKWKQIKTENFQIIYPDFFESGAQRMANIYDLLYSSAHSLNHKPHKISMIVHAQSAVSNGSVGWAPKKSDLYSLPPQDANDEWLEHLCVHEFRHVVQFDKINQGFTKALYYIFGQQMVMAVTGLFLPMWFVEGDAVTFETAVGNIGRGRSPEFLGEMKAQLIEKGIYSYDKAVLGSDKDFVPNRYTLGYFLTANSRRHYGTNVWEKMLNRVGRRPFTFTPFRTSIKQTLQTSRDSLWNTTEFQSLFVNADSVKKSNTYSDAKKTLYFDNLTELKARWQQNLNHSAFDTVATYNPYFTNYRYPVGMPDGSVIAYKDGLSEHGVFVRIKNGKETVITATGMVYDHKFAVNDNVIVWCEQLPALRWEHAGKIVLTSYNLKTNSYRYHRSHKNRFSPFSAGNLWGAVEVDENNNSCIILLANNLEDEVLRVNANTGELFIHPSSDGENIVTVVQTTKGNYLELIDIKTGKRTKISDTFKYELDNPMKIGENVFFRASFDGNNSLYSLNIVNNATKQVLTSPFGIRFPSVAAQKNELNFSFYTANGYKPAKINISELEYKDVEMYNYPLAQKVKEQENISLQNVGDSTFTSKKYRKLPHLLNFHSWGPMYVNQFDGEVDFGLVAYSQNKLSTLSFAAGFVKTNSYKDGAWVFNAAYKGLFPKFYLDFKHSRPNDTWNGTTVVNNLQTGEDDNLLLIYKERLTEAQLDIELPFNISRRNYHRSITPFFTYSTEILQRDISKAFTWVEVNDDVYIYDANLNNYKESFDKDYYQRLEYGLNFSNYTYLAQQMINPRWGQILQIGYTHTPWKKADLGKQWWAAGTLYFPGFALNHSFSLYGGYQNREEVYYYKKKILIPRGMNEYAPDFLTVRSTYSMPLAYPDFNIGSLLYIKTIKGSLFFDFMQQEFANGNQQDYSCGVEVNADCHFLRLPFPTTIGFRAGYETQTKSAFSDFLMNVSFYF
ncbi:MAG: hypothetical protein LBM07_05650 [Culturomica sp.]|jgi:hypothetical protein|nr:hypothetical protein [Culturomica sp.]